MSWLDLVLRDLLVKEPQSVCSLNEKFPSNPLQMYHAQTEAKCSELLACIVLAAQVLNLGLWHARPCLWHQCGHHALAPRYKDCSSLLSTPQQYCRK